MRFQYLFLLLWLIHSFSYTLSPALLSISFILLCLPGLFLIKGSKTNPAIRLLIWLFVAYYLSSCASYFYSENTDEALRKLILKLPLLCFPLLYFVFSKLQARTFMLMTLIWLYAMYLPGMVSVYNYFSNKTLFDQLILESKPLPVEFGYGIYHIQFSILLASSVLLGIYALLSGKISSYGKTIRLLLIYLLVANVICLHILSARTGLLAMYAGFAMLLLPGFRHLKTAVKVRLTGAALVLPLLFIVFSSSLRNRMQNSIRDIQVVWEGKDANDYSFAMRVKAWRNAANLIAKSPLLGQGIGDAESALYSNFEISNPDIKPQNRKNPHFQFLETAVQSGLLSAFLFLSVFIFATRIKQSGKPLLGAVAVLLYVSSCFESILERQASVAGFCVLMAFGLAFGLRAGSAEDTGKPETA